MASADPRRASDASEVGESGCPAGPGGSPGLGDPGAVQARYGSIAPLAQAVCQALAEVAIGLGFAPGAVAIPDPGTATYRLARDPASGQDSLIGEWRDGWGQKQGNLVFHPDGSFFVEYDVVRAHPRDPRWFVEAVNAWGRDPEIRAEARLLQALD